LVCATDDLLSDGCPWSWRLHGARLIDGTGAAPMLPGMIRLEGERIVEVGPELPVPAGARLVEMRKAHMMTSPLLSSIGQIAIRVVDLDRAIATYRDRLGLRFLFRAPPALAFFECNGVRLMLSPSEPGEFDHAASILYFSVQDIEAVHAELSRRAVTFRSAPHPIADLGDRVLWLSDFEDGEGNVFALMAEIPKAAAS